MDFTSQTVESRPGLTQEQALESLQDHPEYKTGTKISSFRRRQDRWVAKLLVPTAAFPPPKDDEESDSKESPVEEIKPAAEESDDSEDSGEKKPPPFAEKKEEGEGDDAKGELGEVLKLLHSIADKLGIDSLDEELLGDEAPPGPAGPPPGGPPKGPPPGGPAGPGGAPRRPPALRPGMTPPGGTPVGAPAFASTKVPTITVETKDPITVKQAKTDLVRRYGSQGYKVKQIKRDGEVLRALISIH